MPRRVQGGDGDAHRLRAVQARNAALTPNPTSRSIVEATSPPLTRRARAQHVLHQATGITRLSLLPETGFRQQPPGSAALPMEAFREVTLRRGESVNF